MNQNTKQKKLITRRASAIAYAGGTPYSGRDRVHFGVTINSSMARAALGRKRYAAPTRKA